MTISDTTGKVTEKSATGKVLSAARVDTAAGVSNKQIDSIVTFKF
jgi:hypothetical protein